MFCIAWAFLEMTCVFTSWADTLAGDLGYHLFIISCTGWVLFGEIQCYAGRGICKA